MMNSNPLALILVAATLFVASLASQTRSDRVVFFVRSASTGNYLAGQNYGSKCTAANKMLPTVKGLGDSRMISGGAAFDPSTDAMWVSDGTMIWRHEATNSIICAFKATVQGKGWTVTGLAFKRSTRQLIQLEMGPAQSGSKTVACFIRTYDASKCPAVPQKSTCKGFTIPSSSLAQGSASGLAYDEIRDFVMYSISTVTSSGALHEIVVAKLAKPCTPFKTIRKITAGGCASAKNIITGMAYSECGQILYVNFKDQTRLLKMQSTATGTVVDITKTKHANVCCPTSLPSSDHSMGIAVVPGGYGWKIVGKSCVPASCGSCNQMRLIIKGPPLAGNPRLGLVVRNAPTPSIGFVYASIGACTTKPFTLPGICGPIYLGVTPGMPLLLGSGAISGKGACQGSLLFNVAIPALRAICDLQVCLQYLVVCPKGNALTHAVEIKFGG